MTKRKPAASSPTKGKATGAAAAKKTAGRASASKAPPEPEPAQAAPAEVPAVPAQDTPAELKQGLLIPYAPGDWASVPPETRAEVLHRNADKKLLFADIAPGRAIPLFLAWFNDDEGRGEDFFVLDAISQ